MDQAPTLRLKDEQLDRAVEVADGFWIIATRHRPGYTRFNPEVNNRVLVFRLMEAGVPVLVVVNAVESPAALAEVQRLERETRAPVRYLLAPGGGHSVMLPAWHDALPNARVLVGPARIPRLVAGKRLANSPRFALLDANDPLPQFTGQLEAVNFDGLKGFRENVTPKEGGSESRFGLLKMMLTEMPPKDPIDELWLYHVASRTLIGGENLGWILSREAHRRLPLMMRMMMKADRVYVMTGPRGVAEPARVRANWQRILRWPAENLLSYHDSIGNGVLGNACARLAEAVQAVKQA
jgi:hypothetical protein